MQTSEREDEFNTVKICDFGLAQIIDPKVGMAQLEAKCGTIGYMAPEIREVIKIIVTSNRTIGLDQRLICGAWELFSMRWLLPISQPRSRTIDMV